MNRIEDSSIFLGILNYYKRCDLEKFKGKIKNKVIEKVICKAFYMKQLQFQNCRMLNASFKTEYLRTLVINSMTVACVSSDSIDLYKINYMSSQASNTLVKENSLKLSGGYISLIKLENNRILIQTEGIAKIYEIRYPYLFELENTFPIDKDDTINTGCFNSNFNILMVGLEGGDVRFYSKVDSKELVLLYKSDFLNYHEINQVCYNSTYNTFFSAGGDSLVRLYTVKDNQVDIKELPKEHKMGVILINSFSNRIYTAGRDRTIMIWDYNTFKVLRKIKDYENCSFKYIFDNNALISNDFNNRIEIKGYNIDYSSVLFKKEIKTNFIPKYMDVSSDFSTLLVMNPNHSEGILLFNS